MKRAKRTDHFEELMSELKRPSAGSEAAGPRNKVVDMREDQCRQALPCADLTCPCRVVNKKG